MESETKLNPFTIASKSKKFKIKRRGKKEIKEKQNNDSAVKSLEGKINNKINDKIKIKVKKKKLKLTKKKY